MRGAPKVGRSRHCAKEDAPHVGKKTLLLLAVVYVYVPEGQMLHVEKPG